MRENETYMNITADSELHEEKKRLENVKTLRQPKLQAPVGEKDAHAKGWRRRDTQDRTGAGAPKRKMGSEKMSENPADECSGAASERSLEKAQKNCKHAKACLKTLDRGSTEFDTKMCELRTCGGSFSAEPKSIWANKCSAVWTPPIARRSAVFNIFRHLHND